MYRRCAVVLLSTFSFLCAIAFAFWHQDWKYSLPVLPPEHAAPPRIGDVLPLAAAGLSMSTGNTPILLHFFNPDCPCSRFNLGHIRDLIREYGDSVRFIAVLHGEGSPQYLQAAFEKLSLKMESFVDESGAVAKLAGVYATPQAVVLSARRELYFRGNYNSSRYCSDERTAYARIALDALRSGLPPRQEAAAFVAYGCPLPKRNSRRRPAAQRGS